MLAHRKSSIYVFAKYKSQINKICLKIGIGGKFNTGCIFFFLLRSSRMNWRFFNCLYLNLDLTRYKPVKGFVEQITHAKLYYKFCSVNAKTKIPELSIHVF